MPLKYQEATHKPSRSPVRAERFLRVIFIIVISIPILR
nr:MAG TPA: hypothetical protein [Caudoviricetes sp.]